MAERVGECFLGITLPFKKHKPTGISSIIAGPLPVGILPDLCRQGALSPAAAAGSSSGKSFGGGGSCVTFLLNQASKRGERSFLQEHRDCHAQPGPAKGVQGTGGVAVSDALTFLLSFL